MDEADQLADLDAAIAGVERIVARIGAGQWELPTPCDGVDVRGMVNHLVTGNLAFVTLVTGTEPPVRDADHLGDDPFFAFRASADLLAAALRTPGVAAGTYELPFGPVPGTALAGIRITEFLGHGANLVTGDYSRGASGLWISGGEFAYPVEEITVAGNLKEMFFNISEIASDLEFRGSVAAPTLRIDGLTVGGE